jgi:hypothetical protein
MSGAPEAPVCVAIVLCNDCIEDKRTNNKTLIGLFNAITAQSMPVMHSRMVVMASITNASKTLAMVLSIRSPSGEESAHIEAPFPATDPLAAYDIVFELNGVVLTEPGTYNVDLLCDGAYLGGRRFDVIMANPIGG